ncbi:MAG: glycoside hydrolase family 97 protein [Bacteroidetes bacterium]|nr:glycoside hydrolase family 97 protein [Bacteroidota bacterium]
MKKISTCFLLLSFFFFANAKPSITASSPDKSIRLEVSVSNVISCTVQVDGKQILQSNIDLELSDGKKLSDNASVKSSDIKTVDETIISPVPYQRRNIPDNYTELKINLKNSFGIIFRIYNDGIAYRIATAFKDSIIIKNEKAIYKFTSGSRIIAPIMQQRENQDKYHTSFEELYQNKPLDSLQEKDMMFSPALVDEGNLKIAVTESDLDEYPGMFLKGTGDFGLQGDFAPYPLAERIAEGDYPAKIVTKRADYIAKTTGKRNLPWRVFMIAREDKQLPANDIVYRLAAPSTVKDPSWIHPGKCTDEWIIDVNLFNVPFKTGVNTASYKYYIDFAKRFGFDRIMMDAGWSDAKDLFKINPNINMDSITAYAKEKGVKISMWTLSMTLDKQLEAALDQFNKWGVDFIMTDFIDRDDQPTVSFYKRIAEACARHHLMIMFHGAYPPKGFNRTYPNNITREAVLGSEYNAWSDKPTPEHDLTLPFTRMLAGPLDYEPGILDNATKIQFKPIWGKVMSQGTRCHQLSMFVVYDNPLQIFSGNPSQGFMEPAFMEFLGSFPTVWDTTAIIDAKVSDYIITARKKGDDWFVAGMTDWTARSFDIPLNFLADGNYESTLCADGINAERYPSDYTITSSVVNVKDKVHVSMAPGGGFVLRLKKK